MSGGAKPTYEEITLKGAAPIKVGTPDVRVLIRDDLGHPLLVSGATKPTDNDNGYAPGCVFIKTSHTSGATGNVHVNVGTYENCDFDNVV